MKKVLFATTALIATASIAAAEVRISGYGRFGVDYNEANKLVPGRSSTNITSRLRLQFDMSTETDSGVTLGARLRMQTESRDNVVNGNGLAGTTSANGARFFAAFGPLTVFVGNIIGALDNLPGIYLPTTSVAIGVDGMGFNQLVLTDAYTAGTSTGIGPNGVEALYSANGFVGHISWAQAPGIGGVSRTGIMGSYNWSNFTVAAAYQDSSAANNNIWAITGSADYDTWGVQIAYADNDGSTKWMLAGNVDVGAAGNIVGYYSDNSAAGLLGTGADGSAYGIEYNYDLGGGSTFIVAVGQNAMSNTEAQAGVRFNF